MKSINVVLPLVWASVAVAADRPNILFILADDLGPEWLSCYGGEHRTPNLDRLAGDGIRFETVYATPLCTPTRHEMLTGRYPFRTGWTTHYDTPRWGGHYFDWNREVTFARVLRDAGYATAIAGKWQMNDFRTHPDALRRHGFDEHCVWPGAESDNPPAAERYFDPFIQTNGKRETRKGEFGPDLFTDFIIDFMTRHRDGPFLAYYPMVLTHTPFTHTPKNLTADLKGAALHPGMVDHVDDDVGRLLAALDRLGLRDKTIVFFTTDNGTVSGVRCRVNGRMVNGGKGTLRETGIRAPLIVNWPGHIQGEHTSKALVDFSDFFPTLLDVTGAALPPGVTIDGRSFAPLLRGDVAFRPREWIYSQLGAGRVVTDGRFKLYATGQLFDIPADPVEAHDLAGSESADAASARKKLEGVLKSFPPDAKLPFPPRRAGSGPAAGE